MKTLLPSFENDIVPPASVESPKAVNPEPQRLTIFEPAENKAVAAQPIEDPTPIILGPETASLVPVVDNDAEKSILPFFSLDSDDKQVKTVEPVKSVDTVKPVEPVAIVTATEPTETKQNNVATLYTQKKHPQKKGGNKRSGRKDARKAQQAADRADMDSAPIAKKPAVVTPAKRPATPAKPKETIISTAKPKSAEKATKTKSSLGLGYIALSGMMALSGAAARLVTRPKANKPEVRASLVDQKSAPGRIRKGVEAVQRHKALAVAVGATVVGAYFAVKHGFDPFNDATESANNTDITGQGALGQEAAPTKAPSAPPEVPSAPVAPAALAAPELGDLVTVSKGDGMTDLIKQLAQDQGLEISGSKSFSMYEQVRDQLAGADGTYQTSGGEVRIRQASGQFRFPIEAQRMLDDLLEAEKKRKGLA